MPAILKASLNILTLEIHFWLKFNYVIWFSFSHYISFFFFSNADGPYGLRVKSDKGLNIGAVFTVDMGEVVLFDCSADSNPPNTYSWIQRDDNTTQVIKYGPHLEVVSDKVAQKTIDYMCCAFNNVTGKRDETHFTVVVTSVGKNVTSLLSV